MRRRRVLLVLTAALFALAQAQRPGYTPPKWAQQRFYSVSTEAPLTAHMGQFASYRIVSSVLSDHLAHVERTLLAHLRGDMRPNDTQRFQACNHDGRGIANSADTYLAVRGLPPAPLDCFTDVADATLFIDRPPAHPLQTVYAALRSRAALARREARALAGAARAAFRGTPLLEGWDAPDVVLDVTAQRGSVRCVLQSAGGVRVGAHWYGSVAVTNADKMQSLPVLHRQFVHELARVTDDGMRMEALPMILPGYAEKVEDERPVRGTTTVFTRFRGIAGASTFASVIPAHNPALRLARDKMALAVQQADDALAPSSLAILLLPLALNLIPIALFASVTTRVMVAYTVFSDVVSVVPLAIKGAELIVIGGQRPQALGTRMSLSLNGTTGAAAVAEVWGAECRAKGNVRPLGIAFVALAGSFMALGVAAEVWARRFVRRRAESDKYEFEKLARDALVRYSENYDDESYMSSMREPTTRGSV